MGATQVQLLDETWTAWLVALDRFPRERMTEPGVCGHWSAKDLVGHVALWDREVLTDICRWELGLPFIGLDWQQMNDDDVAAKADRSFDLLRVEMYAAHAATRLSIENLTDNLDEDIFSRIGIDTWEHYPQHTRDILKWLEREGL